MLNTGIVHAVDRAKTDTKLGWIVIVSLIGFVRKLEQSNRNSIGNVISFLINSEPVSHRINDDSLAEIGFQIILRSVYLLSWTLLNSVGAIGVSNRRILPFNVWLFSIHWWMSTLS